jgi:hypothetical protein
MVTLNTVANTKDFPLIGTSGAPGTVMVRPLLL